MEDRKRLEIIEYGNKILEEHLTFGSGGNLSLRYDENMLITPSGVPYEELQKLEIVYMNYEGEVIIGKLKPSSEYMIHSKIYQERKDINAIIHTHSKYINVLGAIGEDLKAVHYLIASSGDSIVKVAPYETYGTKELAERALEYLENRKAVILANHGLVACGENLEEALQISRDLEFCAFVYVKALAVGKVNIIPDEKIKEVVEKFKTHGQI